MKNIKKFTEGIIRCLSLLALIVSLTGCYETPFDNPNDPLNDPQIETDQPPAIPTGLNAGSATTTSLSLSWDAVSNATGYRLYRSFSETGNYSQTGEDMTLTSYVDSSLSSGTTYYYKVSAFNSYGESDLSDWESGTTTTSGSAPATPTGLNVDSVSTSSISLSWDDVTNADGYRLYKSTSATGTYNQVGGDLVTASYNDTGLSSSTTYYYKIRAFNGYGESVLSNYIPGTTTAIGTAPSTPTGLNVTSVTSSSISLSWNSVTGATGYRIYRSTSATGNYTQVGGNILTYYCTDSGLSSSTAYYYKVSAYNTYGESVQSDFTYATTNPGAPGIPTGLNASSATMTSLTISWNSVSGADGYRLLRSTSGGSYTQIAQLTTETSFLDSGLSSETTYYYEIYAYNGYGAGDLSDYASGSTLKLMSWVQVNGKWSARENHTSVVFENKIWVIGGRIDYECKNDVWYSTDGLAWMLSTANAGWTGRDGHASVVFDNKIWILGGYDGNLKNDVWYSNDGVNWTQATANAGWSSRRDHTCVVFDNKIWISGGFFGSSSKNDVWYSSDGVSWTQATANANWLARYEHSSVVFENKIWIFGGYGNDFFRKNDVWYSTDGNNWIRATPSASWDARNEHQTIIHDNKIWLIGGRGENAFTKNDVWYSSDGINWIQAASNASFEKRSRHSSVEFNNKIWIFGGRSYSSSYINDVWSSSDGATWAEAKPEMWSARIGHTSVELDNKIWVLGGYDISSDEKNDVWNSSDGISWNLVTSNADWPPRNEHTSVVFDNKIWVIGGIINTGTHTEYSNDVWFSSDGISWSQSTSNAEWSRRRQHKSVVFDNKIWILGGYDTSYNTKNDVWYSNDGINWIQATSNAEWSARNDFSSIVFENKIWILGGGNNSADCKNDVWYSSDGVNWTIATLNAGWNVRDSHTSVIFNNKIWIFGGGGSTSTKFNDIWYSTNGITWTQATSNAEWPDRSNHTGLFFNERMWVLGGIGDSGYLNDVWYGELNN